MKIQTLEGKVVKKGRKWLKIVQKNGSPNFLQDLLINELTKELNVDDTFSLKVKTEENASRFGTSYKHYAISEEEIRWEQIDKWWDYVQKVYHEDKRMYQRGIEELHALNCHDFDEEIKEMERDCNIRKAIYWIRHNYNENGKIYEKGIHQLLELNCHDYDDEIKEIRAEVEQKQKEYEEQFYYTGSEFYTPIGTIFAIGDKAYKILSYSKEIDGRSFGYGTDIWYQQKCLNVSDTDEGRKEIELQKKANQKNQYKREVLNPLQKKLNDLIEDLKKEIRSNDFLQRKEVQYPQPNDIQITIYDSIDIYGSGFAIFIDQNDLVWHVINNGSDDAMWAVNHIQTGGAGAYGYICNKEDVQELLNEYFKVKSVLKEKQTIYDTM